MLHTNTGFNSVDNQADETVKYFYKTCMEAFSEYAVHMAEVSDFIHNNPAKYFDYIGLEGERVGAMQRHVKELQI